MGIICPTFISPIELAGRIPSNAALSLSISRVVSLNFHDSTAVAGRTRRGWLKYYSRHQETPSPLLAGTIIIVIIPPVSGR